MAPVARLALSQRVSEAPTRLVGRVEVPSITGDATGAPRARQGSTRLVNTGVIERVFSLARGRRLGYGRDRKSSGDARRVPALLAAIGPSSIQRSIPGVGRRGANRASHEARADGLTSRLYLG